MNKVFNCLIDVKNIILNNKGRFYSFIRFGIVGVINTLHYYIWYLIFLKLKIPYIISHSVAFFISMVGSFFLNCCFTFKVKPTLRKFIQFPLTTLANYLISTFSLILLVNLLHIGSRLAALYASILPIPITFFVTHLILNKKESMPLK